MKLITRHSDYAIGALLYLAKNKKRVVCVKELVKELWIPQAFLRRLLQVLGQKNILESYKGKGGGFRLKVSAQRIPIAQIIRIFQGDIGILNCLLKKEICPNRSSCVLRSKIKAIENRVVKELESITIASLLEGRF
jgi:Rrf2 family protein